MSRGGYAKAERELLGAKRKRLEESAGSDPSVLLDPPLRYVAKKNGCTLAKERAELLQATMLA